MNHVGYTCDAPGICACGAAARNRANPYHTGGTVIRNAVEATHIEKGYMGDTHCLGCGARLASGEEIPAKGFIAVKIEDDADVLDVTFTTLEPVAAIVGSDVEIEYITVADKDIYVSAPPVVLNGVTYYMDEIIVINGEEFLVVDTDSHKLKVMRLSDSVQLKFDEEKLIKTELPGLNAEKREN